MRFQLLRRQRMYHIRMGRYAARRSSMATIADMPMAASAGISRASIARLDATFSFSAMPFADGHATMPTFIGIRCDSHEATRYFQHGLMGLAWSPLVLAWLSFDAKCR